MRQLLIEVPAGEGADVLDMARTYDGQNLVRLRADGIQGEVELIYVHVSNDRVEGLLGEIDKRHRTRVILSPTNIMPLHPPADEAAEQVIDVAARSPIEVFLSSLQSMGSWNGFLGYAVAAGIVVWIALFINSIFLQIAAMLIAPFAGPAMNTAVATARGDLRLLGRNIARYVAGIAVTIGVSALLTWVFGNNAVTNAMVTVSKVSSVAVMLPLITGAAGAFNLVQSDNSSLVPGAATGALVAAALAPPAGVIGMAAVIGRWEMVHNGIFLLMLQLVGINLTGALIFRFYGLSPDGPRYHRGRHRVTMMAMTLTTLALAGLLVWQFYGSPITLQRSSVEQRVAEEVQTIVETGELAELIESNIRFTHVNISGQSSLLMTLYVHRRPGVELSTESIRRTLRERIAATISRQFNVVPLVDLTVLEEPLTSARPSP